MVSVDELNQKIATLEKEKNKEEEYRNYMQLERVSCNNPQDVVNASPFVCDCLCLACFAMSLTYITQTLCEKCMKRIPPSGMLMLP